MYEPIEDDKSKIGTFTSNNSCAVAYLFLLVALVCVWYVFVIIQGDFTPELGSGSDTAKVD